MDIHEGRDVTVNVDARPPRASWLWKFVLVSLLFLGVLELASIERHLRLIAEAQAMQAMGAATPPPRPPAEPSTGPGFPGPNRTAKR